MLLLVARIERWTITLTMSSVLSFVKVVFLICLIYSMLTVSYSLVKSLDLGFTVVHVVLDGGNSNESTRADKGISPKPIYW